MKQNINKKYSLVLIIFLVIVTIGLTYSFFANQGNILFNNDVNVTSNTTDLLTFQIDNDIDFEVSQQDFVSGGNNKSGYTNARAILVPNNKTGNATMSYYMYLNIEENPIDYSSTNTNELPELMLQLYDGNNELVTIDYLDEMVTVKGVTGYDITGYEGLIPLLDNQEIVATNNNQVTQEWKVVVTFINLDINQNDNTGKELVAEVIMQKDSLGPENFGGNLAAVIENELSRSNSLMKEYRGEGYYHDETDKDTEHPFFTRPIYYWDTETSDKVSEIKNKWNVVFADSCWQIMRTTENGGVKLLYNGSAAMVVDDKTGEISYNCSDSRTSSGGVGTRASVSFNGNYYYGDGFEYDHLAQKYKLTMIDDNPILMSSSNGESLEGRYTCQSTTKDGTCATLYYIDEYISGSNAYAISLVKSSYRDNLGVSSFDTNYTSLAYVGYMYGDVYPTLTKDFNDITVNLLTSTRNTIVNSSVINTSHLFADSYTISGNTYNLTNSLSASSINNNSNTRGYADLLGMYTCLSTSNSCTTIYQIVKVSGQNIFYTSASNGVLMISPTLYSITNNNDQALVQSRASAGTSVDIISNVSNYIVTSFKLNGTTMNGNTFVMPSENVTITDLVFTYGAIAETEHYPHQYYQRNEIYFENTYENATSINVEITNQLSSSVYDYIYLYDSVNNTIGRISNYNLTTTNYTINGNYLKITFRCDSSSKDYYGFKAIIIPDGPGYGTRTITEPGDGSGSLANHSQYIEYYLRVGSTITDNNNGTYSLNNPINANWKTSYDDYKNYYVCSDGVSTTCSYDEMRKITSSLSTSYNYNGGSVSSFKVASTITKNGNNYILNNPVTIDAIKWQNDYENYTNYYICNDGISTTCTLDNLRYMFGTIETGYKYYQMYFFSNKYTYNNGTYTLDLSDSNAINIPGQLKNYDSIGNAHYTCFNTSGVCNELYYIYNVSYIFDGAYGRKDYKRAHYIALTNGKYVSTDESDENKFKSDNNALYAMLYSDNVNRTNSTIKDKIDWWYKAKLLKYTPYLDSEEIYCNDRRIVDYGSWNNSANSMSSLVYFNDNIINNTDIQGNINCINKTDAYSALETSLGNGDLNYPIAIASAPELSLIENALKYPSWASFTLTPYFFGIVQTNYVYEPTGKYYIISHQIRNYDHDVLNAEGFSDGGCGGNTNSTCIYRFLQSSNGIRPSIALIADLLDYSQGDGSATNPYVISVGNRITLNDINYKVSKKKAVQGEKITITNNKYIVGSFKLNGTTITGNTFIMPDEDVEITDIKVYKIKNNSNNTSIILPNSAIPGSTTIIKTVNEGYAIRSFKMNGTTLFGNSFVMPQENAIITDIVVEDALSALRNNPNYEILDYLILTGTQYIDPEYPIWKDGNWKIEYKFDVSQHYNYNNMLGFSTVTDTNNEVWIDLNGDYIVRFPNTGRQVIQRLSLNTPYTITHDNTGSNLLIYINGELISTLSRANTASSNSVSVAHRSGGDYLKGNMYYIKFWSNDELVRWLVPVLNKLSGAAGMYDVINGVFYTNQGSGTFIVPS